MASSQPLHELNSNLLRAYGRRGDVKARNRLVELNLPLVRKVAHQESGRTDLPFDDLVQLGCLGLIQAIEAFDASRQSALSSFAVPYIWGILSLQISFSQCWQSLTAESAAPIKLPGMAWTDRLLIPPAIASSEGGASMTAPATPMQG